MRLLFTTSTNKHLTPLKTNLHTAPELNKYWITKRNKVSQRLSEFHGQIDDFQIVKSSEIHSYLKSGAWWNVKHNPPLNVFADIIC